MSRKAFYIIAILISFFVSSPLQAADSGVNAVNTQLFRPVVDGSGVFSTYGSEVPGHLNFTFGLFANLSADSAKVSIPAIPLTVDSLEYNLTGDFLFAMGIKDFLMIGIDIPVAFYEQGTSIPTLATYKTASICDLRLDIKYRFLNEERYPLGMAVLSSLTFPTGNRRKFTGDKNISWELRLVADKTIDIVSLYANLGYRVVDAVTVNMTSFDDELTFSTGAKVMLPWWNERMTVMTEFVGKTVVKDFKKTTTPFEVLFGAGWRWDNGLALIGGAGAGLTNAVGAPSYRVFASLSYDWSRVKRERRLIDTVYFRSDSYRLSPKAGKTIEKVADVMSNKKHMKVIVEGHTDSIESEAYNERLGLRRAKAVSDRLQKYGVESKRIKLKSFGERKPVESNATSMGRRKNRRVEIKE